MIKQVQWSDNQVIPQQVPASGQEVRPQQFQRTEPQRPDPIPGSTGQEVRAKQPVNPLNVVDSVGAIPHELYDRLGLTMPRWLLWILTFVVGIILSGLLVSTLALWTPLWSNLDQAKDDDFGSTTNKDQVKVPGDLWRKLSQYQLSKPMNILVMGIEPVKGTVDGSPESFAGSSDTMLLIRLNPSDKSIRILSIPRGTMISIPEQGLTKVSEANAKGGPVLAARVVSRTLSNAPIDRYIRISTSGLRQLVEQLGGVDVFVPQAMNYQDKSGGLSVNLASGWQSLNGEQAEQFARFRDSNVGDIPRVQRQQALITALLQRLNSPTVLPRLPQLTRIMRKYFDTNLKMEEMMALANFSVNVERDNFQMAMLPGTFSKFSKDPNSYWLNMTGQQSLMNDYVGVNVPGLKSDDRPVSRLKIAIQNASNQPQLTEKVITYLKSKGFTNIYAVPDWPDTQRQTQIIVQKGNPQPGVDLQEVLGLGQIEVSANGDLESDLTIRIGKDWK
ncbi:LCP family protein [Anabaena cylindrica FACHB-243]|uniref:Cell envelope-related transcriptional attenuator n=1 Tax=Anabaena cylindrica (strain ATCC 27899 / PCC 7122) TaxID=272123 RepID=K9ZF46_ANACC|nr:MULTISPECIES: LCP family protein [Anabaena]AFZ57838.1 cell envelope-related transcriptional attenuator [Anabaena cylindrica PCC 7122]MBD2419251.1 LCP family protein [Anabaena cylindrica FACHB-243]MBY5284073.1 LCP family protein [Anabaena sp. CCAP 1446/1C]MBY5311335.1 LCP family protein [Anabaena sp. CCAP 1446/1C]MCM2408147.1 LCP family protein [Anabaena sp. CCAP 1446/1C]